MNADEVVLNGLRVLAVDDDADSLDLLTILLEEYGMSVTRATSATEALAIIAQFIPDILIIDIAMPDVNGYSLLSQIRNLEAEKGGQIPAIALTAFVTDDKRASAINAGFQIYLTKPFDFAELVTAIADLAQWHCTEST